MNAEGRRARADELATALKAMRIQIGAMPAEAQEDIATFCRIFRNMLAAGGPAHLALMLVSAEVAVEVSRKMAAGEAPPS